MVLRRIESSTESFFTFHRRPMRAANHGNDPDALLMAPHSAVVIQGPILRVSDFTLETIKLYRKTFPLSDVILSTWNDEDPMVLESCRAAGATVVANQKPSFAGPSNVNFQLVSTYGGILEAERLGAEYVLKIRSDERMYGVNVMEFLINLLNMFAVSGGYVQRQRLVTLGATTAKYHPYYFGDLFLFGHIADMKMYWGFPLLRSNIAPLDRVLFNPEIHLAAAFLEKTGRVLAWTIGDSWRAYTDQCVIIDAATLDLYCHKYARWKEDRSKTYHYYARPQGSFSFHEWFNLYTNFISRQIPHDPAAVFRGLKRGSQISRVDDTV